jgi:hypothetical protein
MADHWSWLSTNTFIRIKKKRNIQASTLVIKFASKHCKEIMDVMCEIKYA